MHKFLDPILIVGVLSSIILSFILYTLGLDTYPSTIIGLLGTIITLQIDVIGRTESAVEKTIQYNTSWRTLEQIPWFKENIEQIIQACYLVDHDSHNDIFVENAKAEIERCRDNLLELSRGQLRTIFQDSQLMLRATERTRQSLKAVSVSNPQTGFAWWNGPVGKRYWNSNKDALRRGIVTERIFAYSTWTEELARIVAEHSKEGVKVYTVKLEDLSPNLRVGSIIFDQDFAYELRLSSDGQPVEHLWSIHTSDISRKTKNFHTVKSLATEYRP
jgi:hypothetical protein